jgi:hypothetical protein
VSHEEMRAGMGEHTLPTVAQRARTLERLVVKEGPVVWVADAQGNVPPMPGGAGLEQGCGLYRAGLSFLSSCELTVEGYPLPAPAAVEAAGYEASLAFPEVLGGREDIAVLRTFLVDGAALRQWITVETQLPHPTTVRVTLTFGAGGAEWHEVHDGQEPERDASRQPGATAAILRGVCLDPAGGMRRTTVTADRPPVTVRRGGDAGSNALVALTFQLRPALGEPATLAVHILPEHLAPAPAGGAHTPAARDHHASPSTRAPAAGWPDYPAASAELRQRQARWHLRGALFHTAHPALDAVLRRGAADLRLLLEPTGSGTERAPIAGLPWRNTFCAREALFAALLALPLNPEIAVGVLRLLAGHAGTLVAGQPMPGDARRDDASFATPDVAPLWVTLLAETVEWTGDVTLLEELLPVAWRALVYSERYGEGDEWTPRGGLAIAGDTALPSVPIATQAHVYQARRALARVLRRRAAGNDRAEVAGLELAAEEVRRRIERDYWLPRETCYAPALDGARRPVRAITSSAARVLWARLASGARAGQLAERLLEDDLASGWGLRTRSTTDPDYNPLGEWQGAVWPHDTALAAIGLWRVGCAEQGARLARHLFSAAAAQLDSRLPERFAGDARTRGSNEAPRPCREACALYAPAAASPFGMLGAMLGLEPNALARRLVLRPILPTWLSVVHIQHLRVGAARVNLEVRRTGEDGTCAVSAQLTAGELSVVVQPPLRTRA